MIRSSHCHRPDCAAPVRARGLCGRHYQQWRASAESREVRPRRGAAERALALCELAHLAELGATVRQAAEALGVSASTINRWAANAGLMLRSFDNEDIRR